jgi:hypothetical protein
MCIRSRQLAFAGLLLFALSASDLSAQNPTAVPSRPSTAPAAGAVPSALPSPAQLQLPAAQLEVLQRSPPRVESFALTPMPNTGRARLTVHFAQPEQLARQIPLQLGERRFVLQPTRDGHTTEIDFDAEAFAREQERRANLAKRGALAPIFHGRDFAGVQQLQFIDPQRLRAALRQAQPIVIPIGVVNGTSVTADPSRELMITDVSVVEDPARTFDVCTGQGTKMGAWTFGKLMTDMANGLVDPAKMVEEWLKLWTADQTVGIFTAPQRAATMQNLLLNAWPRDLNNLLDLAAAPMRLLAIVNRIDLRGNIVYGGGAGEGRFVFGVMDPHNCNSQPSFVIILEYGVPISGCPAVHNWAQQWHNLGAIAFGPAFNSALQAITDQFAGANVAPTKPNGSALNQLRTNEVALGFPWELREFNLNGATHLFDEVTVKQTPDLGFLNTAPLQSFINTNQAQILANNYTVPPTFLGASAPNGPPTVAWNSAPPPASNPARHIFSLGTCNACHGRETNTGFFHVFPRASGTPASLSPFLIGNGTLASPNTVTVFDPFVSNVSWTFGDLLRRQADLDTLLGSTCFSGGIFDALSFSPLRMTH